MKKNTLLIQSLLLPLIASSITFSMDTPQSQTEQSTSDSTLNTTTLFYGENQELAPFPPHDSVTADSKGIVTDELNQSVIHPIQDKGLGILETLKYWSHKTNRSLVISFLQNGTFDVTNGSHFILLADALNEAIRAEDVDAIATISTLCQSTKKYEKHINISDDVARPCVGLLDKKYAEQRNAAEQAVQKAHHNSIAAYDAETSVFIKALAEVVCTHREKRNAIAAAYDTTITEEQQKLNNTRLRFSQFAHISNNQQIKEEVSNLLKSGIVAPQNDITDLAAASERIMSAIGTKSDKLPKIAKPAHLLIDNK